MTEDCVKTLDEKLSDWERRNAKRQADEEEAQLRDAERLRQQYLNRTGRA